MLITYTYKGGMKMIDTPSLVLDVKQLDKNISTVMGFAKQHHVNYRPHIKTHKCIEIAKRQIDAGAVGITVATVGEAEVMVDGGINNILIAYPIALQTKLQRILSLLDDATIIVAVDSVEQASILDEFFTKHDQTIPVWIKVNSGLNRCGVEPNEEVVELATLINSLSSLSLEGIFTHAGHSYAATTSDELKAIARDEAEAVVQSANLCENASIQIENRSVGSTPTYQMSGAVQGITEVRPGNSVFNDMIQVGLNVATIEECALTVQASVGSVKRDRIVIDAGSKTLNLDRGAHGNENVIGHGYIKEYPHLIIDRLSEEHGIIAYKQGEDIPCIGEIVTIIPNHACTVANLFASYQVQSDGHVVDEWSVDARGRVD